MNRIIVSLYVLIQAALLVVIKFTERQGQLGTDIDNVFMFIAIVINTIVALYFYFRYGTKREDKRENLVILALVLNLFADYFLSFLDTDEAMLAGICFFCALEIVYAIYLKSPKASVIGRIVLFVLASIATYFVGLFSLLNALGLLNLSVVLFNVIDAWQKKNMDTSLFFKIGITLFCIGDYCILFRTLTSGLIHDVSAFLVWIVYIPSQVLIVLHYIAKLNIKGLLKTEDIIH